MTRPKLYTIERRVTFRMEKRLHDSLALWAQDEGLALNTLMQRELGKALLRRADASEDDGSGHTNHAHESDECSSCEESSPASRPPESPDAPSQEATFSAPSDVTTGDGI